MQHFIQNPFQFEGVVTGEQFCDRDDDISELLEYMYSGNNIIISMKRRVGKTSLIKEIFENRVSEERLLTAYVDIYGITSIKELYYELKEEVEKIVGITDKFGTSIDKIKLAFREATIYAELSSKPKIKIEFAGNDYAVLIKKLLLSLQEFASQNTIIIAFAIDEFQKIAHLPKKESDMIESNMRTAMQKCKNISFILSGSNQTMLDKMFDSNRPLYRQGVHYPLSPIKEEVFYEWASSKFRRKEITIGKDAFSYLYRLSNSEAKIVQQVCFILFSKTQQLQQIELEDVCAAIEKIYKNNSELSAKFNKLKLNEQKMLKIIALENGKGVTVSPLLDEFSVSHGSVSNILKRMVEDYTIIKQEKGQYEIVDTELKLWVLVSKQSLCQE